MFNDRIFDCDGTLIFVGPREEVLGELNLTARLIKIGSKMAARVTVGVGDTNEILSVTEYVNRYAPVRA